MSAPSGLPPSDHPGDHPRDAALLQAYHDGEASAEQRRAAEAWLAEDPAARAALAELAAVDALLREAVDGPLAEPVPPALLARVEATLAGRLSRLPVVAGGDGPTQVPPFAARPTALPGRGLPRWLPALAAAAVALAVALPGAWYWSAARTEASLARQAERRAEALAQLEGELQHTLETQVSGTPLPWYGDAEAGEGEVLGEVLAVRTYKSSAGQWCREYRVTAILHGQPYGERGIACRGEDGRWRRKVLLLDEDPAAPAAPESEVRQDDGQGT